MAGTYSPPEATDVDFTLREEAAPQPEGLEIVVNGDESLKQYSAPDNDNVDLQVQETTVADNDSVDFDIEASSTQTYTAPDQNSVDYTLEAYTPSGQNNVNYTLGEPEQTEEATGPPPSYTSPRPDQLEFTLQGYTSEPVDSLEFTLSQSGITELAGPLVKPVDNTLQTQNPEESAQTITEVGSTVNSLNNTQRERIQQPVSVILESLSAEGDDKTIQQVAIAAESARYTRVLFQGVANATSQSYSRTFSSHEVEPTASSLENLQAQPSDYLVEASDATVVEFETEDTTYTFSEEYAQVESLLRDPDTSKELVELRTENIVEDLFRVRPEMDIGQVLAAVQDLVAQESAMVRSTVTIDPVSLEAREQAGVIAPVGDVVDTLERQQSETPQAVIPNSIENLADSGRKKALQSVVDVAISIQDIDAGSSPSQLFELTSSPETFNYQRDNFLGGEAKAETTQFSVITNGQYEGFEVESRTFARNDRLRQHLVKTVDNTADDPDYVFPEYPHTPGLVTAFDGDLPLSDHEQGYAQFSASSSPIEEQSYLQGAAVSTPEDGGYNIPEYEVGEASGVVVSFNIGDSSHLVGELTSEVAVIDGATNGEHEILFIEMPIEQGLEYFEREDIGPGGGSPTSGGNGLQFSGSFGLIKRGSKSVVLF